MENIGKQSKLSGKQEDSSTHDKSRISISDMAQKNYLTPAGQMQESNIQYLNLLRPGMAPKIQNSLQSGLFGYQQTHDQQKLNLREQILNQKKDLIQQQLGGPMFQGKQNHNAQHSTVDNIRAGFNAQLIKEKMEARMTSVELIGLMRSQNPPQNVNKKNMDEYQKWIKFLKGTSNVQSTLYDQKATVMSDLSRANLEKELQLMQIQERLQKHQLLIQQAKLKLSRQNNIVASHYLKNYLDDVNQPKKFDTGIEQIKSKISNDIKHDLLNKHNVQQKNSGSNEFSMDEYSALIDTIKAEQLNPANPLTAFEENFKSFHQSLVEKQNSIDNLNNLQNDQSKEISNAKADQENVQDSNQEPSEDDGEKTVDENSDESPKDEEVIKRGKGKPKIVIDKYIISCQNMFQKNNQDMMLTNNKNEKQRLKNLNNSMLQRLKKRREQEAEKVVKKVQQQKFTKLFILLNQHLNKRDKKAIMKELQKFENVLREENGKPVKSNPSDNSEDEQSEGLNEHFKTEMIKFMDAEPYRRVENNSQIQDILLKKPESK